MTATTAETAALTLPERQQPLEARDEAEPTGTGEATPA